MTPGAVLSRPADLLGRRPLVEQDLLRMTQSVRRGGIDPVDAGLDRVVDGSDRVPVVLRPPAALPVAAADRPGAEPDTRDREAGSAERGPRRRARVVQLRSLGRSHRAQRRLAGTRPAARLSARSASLA